MFVRLKNFFCRCDSLEKRREKALEQDKAVRERLSQKQYDAQVESTMDGSDPVAKY